MAVAKVDAEGRIGLGKINNMIGVYGKAGTGEAIAKLAMSLLVKVISCYEREKSVYK